MGMRMAIYGNEVPSKRRRTTILALLITVLALVFGMAQTFVVTPEWHQISVWVAGIVGTPMMLWAVREIVRPQGYLAHVRRLRPLVRGTVWITLPVICYVFVYWTVTHPIPALLTYAGIPSQERSVVVRLEKSEGSWRRCSYRLTGSLLGSDRSTRLCPDQAFYEALPEHPTLEVFGKANWFGFLVDRYRLVEPVEVGRVH